MLQQFFTLLKKEALQELRRKEFLIVATVLAVILSALASAGIRNAFLPPAFEAAIFPTVLWLIFLFAAVVAASRAYEHEFELGGLEALLSARVAPELIYLSKVCVYSILLWITQLFTALIFWLLLGLPALPGLLQFAAVALLVVFGFTALLVLLGVLSQTSRLKQLLFPLILLPLLFPLFFAAIELSSLILIDQRFTYDSTWLSLLIGADIVYFLMGLNLYGYTLRE